MLTVLGVFAALVGPPTIAVVGFYLAINVAKFFIQARYYDDVRINVRDIQPGDHLIVPSYGPAGVRDHVGMSWYHGVYLGKRDGIDMVTDFGAESKEYPIMRPLESFVVNSRAMLKKRVYKFGPLTPSQRIEETAVNICLSRKWRLYDLQSNNCEQYATLLKLGVFQSDRPAISSQDTFYNQFWLRPRRDAGILDEYKTVVLDVVVATLSKPVLPFSMTFQADLSSNAFHVVVTGKISPNPAEFAINLTNSENTLLQINPRWTENKTVFNNKSQSKGWGKEYRSFIPSLIPNQNFKVDIFIEKKYFLVIFNDGQFFHFEQEIPQAGNTLGISITKVNRNDIALSNVTITQARKKS